ncbi:MAG: YdcF family protein [cyanobacterium endosymbiont of Rhopalodia musculus]|uniref:YdcF family protein n=1 Tax=cyanobacterium endosymbiont of Epithemia clementina EcSB TaxID=3034674 RepID=UPI00248020B7|nr:YdcF family protein [cyanobacterium endosymbiont of Epithemia clementina EcSB]WGT68231.1 YdcF family protein [cyanobacterium endosymbiont of Epithemia clementina EcSB]
MLLQINSKKHRVKVLSSRRRRRLWPLISLVGISLWAGYKELQSYMVQPEAIFVLGGHEEREHFAAQLATRYRDLPIWVSSGSPQSYAKKIFREAGISSARLYLDYQARDTVTNFTTLVDTLKKQGIDSVYLVTSANHMNRARVIGEIVFGTRGIILKPIAVECDCPPEPFKKILRDVARSLLWLGTGKTGETLIVP